MEHYFISVGVNLFVEALRDAKKKSKWRATALEIFAAIAEAFGNDADFKAVVQQEKK